MVGNLMTEKEAKVAIAFDIPYLRNVANDCGAFFVLPDGQRAYQVLGACSPHQAVDSAYEFTEDGRSLAIARVNYLAARYPTALDILGWIDRVNKSTIRRDTAD